MADKYFKKSPFSLLQQKVALCSAYKDAKCYIDKKKKQLFWSGQIKSTAFSKEYNILMLYKLWESPKVWVYGDELEKLDAEDFPHKFDINEDAKIDILNSMYIDYLLIQLYRGQLNGCIFMSYGLQQESGLAAENTLILVKKKQMTNAIQINIFICTSVIC